MKEIRQVFLVSNYHFSRWRGNFRVILSFLLGGIMSFLLTEKVMNFSLEYDRTLQMFEPFVWTFGDGVSILLIAIILILLFADMPFLDGTVPYYLVRIRVRTWVWGQILYLCLATFLYMVVILLTTLLFCASNSFTGNLWSPTAALLGYSGLKDSWMIPATLKTFELSRPYQCTLTIFMLMLAYSLLSVMFMYVLTIKKGKLAGVVGVFSFHLVGALLNADWLTALLQLDEKRKYIAGVLCGWLSPISQVTYPKHNFGYDLLPTLAQTLQIFTILIFLLALIVVFAMKKYNFQFIGGEE